MDDELVLVFLTNNIRAIRKNRKVYKTPEDIRQAMSTVFDVCISQAITPEMRTKILKLREDYFSARRSAGRDITIDFKPDIHLNLELSKVNETLESETDTTRDDEGFIKRTVKRTRPIQKD